MTGRNLTVKIRQRINSRVVISVLAAFAVLLSSCVSSSEEKHESCIVGENRSNEIQEDKERIGI